MAVRAATGSRGRTTTLDARYGRTPDRRRRSRITAVVAGAALLLGGGAWAVWTGVGGAAGTLDVDTVAATVHDERSTSVRWLLTGRAGSALVCAIEARDTSGAVVGLVEQEVPATGRADRAGQTLVKTVRRASSGLIVSCRAA